MFKPLLFLIATLLPAVAFSQDDVAVSDQGVSISSAELEQIVSRWTPEMKSAAANSEGERLELINSALAGRKMAAELEAMTPEENGAEYWAYQSKLLLFQRQYRADRFAKTLEIPDMEELARERYKTDKEDYALVPERRLSSHILFQCVARSPDCDRIPLREKAKEVVEELRGGADFEELVAKYSDDPGSKNKGGLFNRWIKLGEMGVEPTYSGGVFEIESIGDYSDVVESRFGLHIIRLDGIEPSHFKPYEEVREAIIADLEKEYRQLSLKEFYNGYRITDDAYINGNVIDKLLAPYKDK